MLAAILLEGFCWLTDVLPYLVMDRRAPSARILRTVWDTPFERRRLQTGAQYIGHVPNTEEACEQVPELPYVRTERTFGFPLSTIRLSGDRMERRGFPATNRRRTWRKSQCLKTPTSDAYALRDPVCPLERVDKVDGHTETTMKHRTS